MCSSLLRSERKDRGALCSSGLRPPGPARTATDSSALSPRIAQDSLLEFDVLFVLDALASDLGLGGGFGRVFKRTPSSMQPPVWEIGRVAVIDRRSP